jgi:trimeric autotransporter adhesin
VKGGANIEGLLALPTTGAATASAGKISQAQNFVASSYNSSTATAVNQTFQWRAEPVGNDSATPSGTLSLLFGSGPSSPAETGLKLSNKGLFTFATGQTFPGTGTITGVTTANGSGLIGGNTKGTLNLALKTCTANQVLQFVSGAWTCSNAGTGTITGVIAGTDLTGGGPSGSVTLNVDTTKIPQLNAANTFTGNQTITGNLTDTGNITSSALISGQTGSFSGNNTTQILNVTQSGNGAGILANSQSGAAVEGVNNSPSGFFNFGVAGGASGTGGIGVAGSASSATGGTVGVYGQSTSTSGTGVQGLAAATSGSTAGVMGQASSPSGIGVHGVNSAGGIAGQFDGPVVVNGNLSDTGNISSTGLISGRTATFGGSTSMQLVTVVQSGMGVALSAQTFSTSNGTAAIVGNGFYGVDGLSSAAGGIGVNGYANNATGFGVYGSEGATTGTNYGVYGTAASPSGYGVYGSGGTGIAGVSTSGSGGAGGNFLGFTAPAGSNMNGTNGVAGTGGDGDVDTTLSNGGVGVVGIGGTGVYNNTQLPSGGPGSGGQFLGGTDTGCTGNGCGGDGVDAAPGNINGNVYGYAGNFTGDLNVSGIIIAGTKDFKIDHPVDPANKYLFHASVESSEMMNIYTGNVSTDAQGQATVQLPEWFEVLNTDFRYQLTVIGQFAQAIVSHEIESNRFEIRTNVPNVKVSWQVTGVRQDAFAKANPLVVEQEKESRLRGYYIHPELYGAPAEKQIEWARHPQMMKKMQEMRARQLAAAQKQPAPRN